MAKKLCTVKLVVTTVVAVDDLDDAAEVAKEAAREDQYGTGRWYYQVDQLEPDDRLPDGWNGGCIPWGEKNDKTIAQYRNEVAK